MPGAIRARQHAPKSGGWARRRGKLPRVWEEYRGYAQGELPNASAGDCSRPQRRRRPRIGEPRQPHERGIGRAPVRGRGLPRDRPRGRRHRRSEDSRSRSAPDSVKFPRDTAGKRHQNRPLLYLDQCPRGSPKKSRIRISPACIHAMSTGTPGLWRAVAGAKVRSCCHPMR